MNLNRIGFLLFWLALTGGGRAEGVTLLDATTAGAEKRWIVRDVQEVVGAGSTVTIKPGPDNWPGISLKPENSATWDLTQYGYAEARVANTGTNRLALVMSLEVGEQGKGCAENVVLAPGASGTVRVYLGFNYGVVNSAFDPARVTQVLLYTKKTDVEESFRIESITAAGKPGDRPPFTPRIRPINGVITGQGLWDLSEYLEVRVKVKNTNAAPVNASVRLESEKGPSDTVTAQLAPGAEAEITVPFTAQVPWRGVVEKAQEVLEGKETWAGEPGTGTKFASHVTKGATVLGDVKVESIVAWLPKYERPAWLGRRPPVEGEWTKTFEDNFDGTAIDLTKWNIYSENYGNQRMHFSRDNVIVKGGKLALRFEKKRGRHNDDPNGKETDYATGWADTYGKWVQRYGYFESRMKLPSGPNRFTAFWLMPDRGLAAGPQHIRASTKDGGMEFDIMETLSIWGIHRHDFGMHWDGYGKYHKSNGDFTFYQQADSEGFITVGMLWTPGLVVMFDNGREAARWESPRISSIPSYLIFDHVMGGWETEPMDETKLPEDLVVDYVRVWQRKDLASPVDGPKPNKGGPLPPKE
jgi:beta-glucanase (GH16 family)